MKEITIRKNESGQRLDKYLRKLLPNASAGFLYKMLRKKNITLNNKKVQGKEELAEGDILRIFFSDETFAQFSRDTAALEKEVEELRKLPMKGLKVIYEDEDILALNKPYNMLSQKAAPTDVSANELMLGYLIREGVLNSEAMKTFRPSVCNRLDRNTTGILLAGKSLKGLQELSAALKTRDARKYYRAIVSGAVTEPAYLKGWLVKDERLNQVRITEEEEPDAQRIETSYEPLKVMGDVTLLEIHLITGRSHQIRAHLASTGHPIIGDVKYGRPEVNEYYRKKHHIHHQLLHAYRVTLPGKQDITAPEPREFRCMEEEKE